MEEYLEGENCGEKGGESRKIDPFCFGLRQKHLDEGQRQGCGEEKKEQIWSCSKGIINNSVIDKMITL